ncbi:MAG TPA: family 16 glycoside hydrolase [Pirellulaceae bacterium]|nr:family 16 glycoside hydrolase [Pirellulaceae bacterium]
MLLRYAGLALFAWLSCSVGFAADETSLFNGQDLTGWQTKAGESLEKQPTAFGGRFKVADGNLVIDDKVKGDVVIETVAKLGAKSELRFEFLPNAKCNNDLYFRGVKFDIKPTDVKNLKLDDWNEFEILSGENSLEFKCNGQSIKTVKTKLPTSSLGIRAEFGAIQYRKLRVQTVK